MTHIHRGHVPSGLSAVLAVVLAAPSAAEVGDSSRAVPASGSKVANEFPLGLPCDAGFVPEFPVQAAHGSIHRQTRTTHYVAYDDGTLERACEEQPLELSPGSWPMVRIVETEVYQCRAVFEGACITDEQGAWIELESESGSERTDLGTVIVGNYTVAQQQALKSLSGDLGVAAAGCSAMLPVLVALASAPEPVLTKAQAAVLGLAWGLTTAAYATSVQLANRLANDPPDPDFDVLPTPVVPKLPVLRPGGRLTPQLARTLNQYMDRSVRVSGLMLAILQGNERADAAHRAGQEGWADEQYERVWELEARLRHQLLRRPEGTNMPWGKALAVEWRSAGLPNPVTRDKPSEATLARLGRSLKVLRRAGYPADIVRATRADLGARAEGRNRLVSQFRSLPTRAEDRQLALNLDGDR